VTVWIQGRPLADGLLDTTRNAVAAAVGRGLPAPTLASVHRAETSPFAVYLKQQGKAAERVGIAFRPLALPAGATATDLRRTVAQLDADPGVHAVILEHPMPSALDGPGALAGLQIAKDVDGISSASLGLLMSHRPFHVPAVARAALHIAETSGLPVSGHRVAVVGRSESVGLPIALLLLARGRGADATVTVAHSKTPDLAAALRGCDVIFSCAGHPGLLDRSTVPEGAAVIDVGLSTVPDPSKPSGLRVVGDADAEALEGWASAVTPVPGGVGPVTVACLMDNARRGWERLVGTPA
jgi:methylenetetrahydrofolate dehydrogenase (NADP+)/methenyltetrahydrofolate cyclohydrolase